MYIHEWRKRSSKQTAYFQLKVKIPAPKYTRTTWSPRSLKLANEHLPVHIRNILYAIWNHQGSVFWFVWLHRYFLSLMIKLKIRVMYSTKSPLISYSFPNTLVQNLITFQHIHTILKSTCSQIELPCMITTASTERHTPPSAHDATDVFQHCHKEKLCSFTTLERSRITTFGSVKSL